MTDEEKAEEYADWFWGSKPSERRAIKQAYLASAEPREKRIKHLEESLLDVTEKSVRKIAELKAKVGLSIDCEKAQKNGDLCLGYGGDEDEPCERCKNCIKCECGYYQLGETEKDDQLTNTKELLKRWVDDRVYTVSEQKDLIAATEQFIREVEK